MAWDDNMKHRDLLFNIHCIGTVLSLIGTLWVIYFCLKSKAYRQVHLRFVFAITLSDFFYAVANTLAIFDGPASQDAPWKDIKPNCVVDAFIRVWSFTFIQLFATALTVLCYQKVKHGRAFNQDSFFNKTVLLGIAICTWATASPLIIDLTHYANGNLCCDVIVDPPNNVWDFILTGMGGAIPVLIMLIVSLVSYIMTIRVFRSYPRELQQENSQIYRLFWYPGTMFLMFLPGLNDIYTINFFSFTKGNSFIMELLHLIMTRSSGLINALVFGVQMKSYYLSLRDRARTLTLGDGGSGVNGTESQVSTERRDSCVIKVQEALLT